MINDNRKMLVEDLESILKYNNNSNNTVKEELYVLFIYHDNSISKEKIIETPYINYKWMHHSARKKL